MKALGLLILLALLGPTVAGCGSRTVTGTISVREGALPSGAVIEVQLLDISILDARPEVVATTTLRPKSLPAPYRLAYDSRKIDERRSYAVSATVHHGEDLAFRTLEMKYVLTHGHPEAGDLVLVPAPKPYVSDFQVAPATAGRLSLSESKLRFEPCGTNPSSITIEDLPTGDGKKLIHDLGQGAGIPVVVRLAEGKLLEIRFAGPGEMKCDDLLWTGELQAKGNEPFWAAYVDMGDVTIVTPENQSGVQYGYGHGKWSHPDSSHWRYEATAREGEKLTLEIEETPCHDSMSGARFPFKAVLVRGGVRMEGCALEGRRAMPAR